MEKTKKNRKSAGGEGLFAEVSRRDAAFKRLPQKKIARSEGKERMRILCIYFQNCSVSRTPMGNDICVLLDFQSSCLPVLGPTPLTQETGPAKT